MRHESITPEDLFDKRRKGESIDLIDVRTPAEFRELHASLARNLPLDAVRPHEIDQGSIGDANAPLYVICHSGARANVACDRLQASGYDNYVVVEGGMVAWEDAGLPVIRGKKTISLERQVRIAAGFLVLLGSCLGFFVHPYFIGLSAFVGGGLMFAGITDTCGMGMLLARMPWNQVPDAANRACGIRQSTGSPSIKERQPC